MVFMSKVKKIENPDYVIYEAIKILEQAERTSIESPWSIKIKVGEALKVLKFYDLRG